MGGYERNRGVRADPKVFGLVPTRMARLYSGLGKALGGALPKLQAPPLLGAKGGCQTSLLRRVWEGRDVPSDGAVGRALVDGLWLRCCKSSSNCGSLGQVFF